MKKLILGLAVATAVVAIPGMANADVSNNGTTNDAWGYCIANHIANFNGDHNGVGWIRSTELGKVNGDAGRNTSHAECTATQGNYAPISNNG